MQNPDHIQRQGSGVYHSDILDRAVDYWFEDNWIIPNLSPDECLWEEDIINEIKKQSEVLNEE